MKIDGGELRVGYPGTRTYVRDRKNGWSWWYKSMVCYAFRVADILV
jgi:hypothetical protein